jgi:hypothetical protein
MPFVLRIPLSALPYMTGSLACITYSTQHDLVPHMHYPARVLLARYREFLRMITAIPAALTSLFTCDHRFLAGLYAVLRIRCECPIHIHT